MYIYILSQVAPVLLLVQISTPFIIQYRPSNIILSQSGKRSSTKEAGFSAFTNTLDEDELFVGEEDDVTTWKDSLDEFMNPLTPVTKKQVLLSVLIGANEEIGESVQQAFRERKIEAILTPTGKKLQDGTRAVARQITSDIIPSISSLSSRSPPIREELPRLVPKIGSRIFNAVSTQARNQFEQIQKDLRDPARIPERISKQTEEFAQEARNVFREVPEGLVGPRYTVVKRADGYEIREYEGYAAAATSMSKIGEDFTLDDVASSGAAFNALAAYIFGANEDEETLDMTTPVATTSVGEMRFYIDKEVPPAPLPSDELQSFNERMGVKLVTVPPARLAVATFPGFATDGEVTRQKDTLLTNLSIDGVEIDVPHGAVVPHVVLQYNSPLTLPIVRRNEIAIPVRKEEVVGGLESEWQEKDDIKGQ